MVNKLPVVRFHPAFTSRMVLQRTMPVRLRGATHPNALVAIRFGAIHVETQSDAEGQWQVELPPMAASAQPTELRLESVGTVVALSDVLVGEVWFCSGQSNMEFPMERALDEGAFTVDANNPCLRLLHVEVNGREEPLDALYGQQWEFCSPENADKFSAVAYYFGQELQARLQVPVGLIHASLGGTVIESWMSLDSLQQIPAVAEEVADFEQLLAHSRATRLTGVCEDEPQLEFDARDSVGYHLGWAEPETDVAGWPQMNLPRQWQQQGYEQSGVFWFRREVEMPSQWLGRDLKVSLGAIDKSDVAYWNGELIGMTLKSPDSYKQNREYIVPASLVRSGANTLSVRVRSEMFDGGITGPAQTMFVACPALGESSPMSLSGAWHFQVENDYGFRTLKAPAQLFNGMVAPYCDFAMRGVIWYQGESNAAKPEEYKVLFPAMVQDWRRAWGQESLAFHFVQLPNYRAPSDQPGVESAWANFREAQTAALQLPNTGMAVAIDLGEEEDIHPRSKWQVGQRLAWSALSQSYGVATIPASGPRLRAIQFESERVRVIFDLFGSSLAVRGDSLDGFAVAGVDGVFFWADAVLDGDTVVLSIAQVTAPKYVRFAWADNPTCTLYNSFGQPAVPFRCLIEIRKRSCFAR